MTNRPKAIGTATGPDSLLVAALGLLIARTLWTLTPKATLS